jgi:hypothetical protein
MFLINCKLVTPRGAGGADITWNRGRGAATALELHALRAMNYRQGERPREKKIIHNSVTTESAQNE